MDRINLHLFLSPIQNETRLVKEARATLSLGVFSRVRVLGLWDKGLARREAHSSGLEICRVRTLLRLARSRFPRLPRGLLTKVLGAIAFSQYGVAASWQTIRLRPSHVTCHNLLLLPIAWIAAKLGGSRLVYAPHELEVERTGLSGSLKRIAIPLERTFIRRCSAVVVVCDPIAEWYRKRYGLANVYVVRAIPDTQTPAGISAHRARIRREHSVPDTALLFIYQGVLGRERGVDELLSTFQELDDGHCHLMLMGYGEAVERILQAAEACPRIHFQPAVPVEQITQYSSAADVGIFVIHGPLSLSYQLCLPNKFFEYLFAGLPVIVSDNLRLLAQITRQNGLGWATESNELTSLIQRLDSATIEAFRPRVAEYVAQNTWDAERAQYRAVYAE